MKRIKKIFRESAVDRKKKGNPRFSQHQVVREYKPLRVIYFGGKHDSRRRLCTTGFIISQSREGSISLSKLKISVFTFLVNKVQSSRGVYFVRIREKPLS